ncbi:hypothetical protein [Lewinella sp. 4G2]|uniref:hypothetical protein n=1 Tax=Lewinella sp. 4G2 TaxID=1803372 RepID=UPI0007B49A13|nr:hypothetical protein [Lewinella sp. 4G2]OAV42928.1 hypothetical protein A3850_017040 [Lewinella sp. 4G2]
MQYFVLALFACLCLCTLGCDGNTKARRAAKGESFVPDPNYLFFKNTRQADYRVLDGGDRGNHFTHDDLYDSDATLLPVIYDNWLEDQAFLELHTRTQQGPAGPSGKVELLITSPKGTNAVSLPARLSYDNAEQLKHHLTTNREINWVTGGDTLVAFPGLARDYATITINDYLRLVQRK